MSNFGTYCAGMPRNACEPGGAFPSERDLTERFGVARMTVRQAIDSLVGEQVLERVVGLGTFVRKPKLDLQVKLTSYSEEMQRRGMVPAAKVLSFEQIGASASGGPRAADGGGHSPWSGSAACCWPITSP